MIIISVTCVRILKSVKRLFALFFSETYIWLQSSKVDGHITVCTASVPYKTENTTKGKKGMKCRHADQHATLLYGKSGFSYS